MTGRGGGGMATLPTPGSASGDSPFDSACRNKIRNERFYRKFVQRTFHGELKTNVNAAEADCNDTVQSIYIRTAIAALRTEEKQPKQTHMQQHDVAKWTQKIQVNGDVNNL